MSNFSSLYIKRKVGISMPPSYLRREINALLIIFLVTVALSFSLVFINSITTKIDRMIALFGSGSVYSETFVNDLPAGAVMNRVRYADALIYTKEEAGAVTVKGVDYDYFAPREEALKVQWGPSNSINPVVISSSLAEKYMLSLGDKFSLLYFEEEKERARPLFCAVEGIFSSVYPRFDSNLVYLLSDNLNAREGYEIVLSDNSEADTLAKSIGGYSYRSLYRSLYDNVENSKAILYLVLVFVALLAAFFSSDIAESFIYRDRKDILHLLVLGLEEKKVRAIYFKITLLLFTTTVVIAVVIGTLLSFLSPSLLSLVSNKAILDSYVKSFTVVVPFSLLILTVLIMTLIAVVSIAVSLRKIKMGDITTL